MPTCVANINSVPLPYFSLNLGDETLVAQHDASQTKLEAGGPICEVDQLLAVPTAVRCLCYCFLRQSACRAAWLGRESSWESNIVLVYLYNSNTRMFEKGCHFLKRSWNEPPLPDMQQYQPSSVRCLRYCLVRRSTCRAAWLGRESAKESNMVLVYTCTIRTHERLKKGAVFLKRVGTSRLYPTCNSTKSVRQHVCFSVAHMNYYVKNDASFSNMKRV